MHEHEHDDPELLTEIEKLGYDPRDVPVEQTWKHAVGLFLSCGVVMLLAALVMKVIDMRQGSSSVGRQDIMSQARAVEPQPPFPRLQSNTAAHKDIADVRHEEAIKTQTYSWVDKSKGVARIPVEVALGLVLTDGLPVTHTQTPPALGVAPGTGAQTGQTQQPAGTGGNAAGGQGQ